MRKYLGAGASIKILLAILGWICEILITRLLGYPRAVIFYLAIVLFGLVGNDGCDILPFWVRFKSLNKYDLIILKKVLLSEK